MDEIGNQLSEIQEIQEVHFLAGDDGYLVKMQVSDTHELGQIVKDDISRIDGIIETQIIGVLLT